MSKFGALYVAHNPRDGNNVFKVGKTERDVQARMAELTSSTSNLGEYSAVAYFVVSDIDAAEATVHQRLTHYRIQDNREFFELELDRLLAIVEQVIEPYRARDSVPTFDNNPTDERDNPSIPLPEKLKKQRLQFLENAQKESQRIVDSEKALVEKLAVWKKELSAMVLPLKDSFKDIPFIRWHLGDEEPSNQDINVFHNPNLIVKALLLAYNSEPPIRLKFSGLHRVNKPSQDYTKPQEEPFFNKLLGVIKPKDLPKPTEEQGQNAFTVVSWEEPDDGRVAQVLLEVRGKNYEHAGNIVVSAESVNYDDYVAGWKTYKVGSVCLSEPAEAIEFFGTILNEYTANPITERRKLHPNPYPGRKGSGTPVLGGGHYRTHLFGQPS